MAKTTDELFAEATEADYETAEPVTLAASDTEEEFQFLIDEHLRTIAIPEKGVVAGVEGDLNVNIARFTMTRYYHGRDLSKLNIRINYRNANGQVNYYTVSDATISGDSIVFSWEYAADVTQYKGNVQFVVYLFSATSAVLKQKFFTTLGTLEVLEGLEVDSSIPVSEQTDILLHLKKDLSAYAEEVKKSLPADYTAMTEQVSSLKEDLNENANISSTLVAYGGSEIDAKRTIGESIKVSIDINTLIDNTALMNGRGFRVDGSFYDNVNLTCTNIIEVDELNKYTFSHAYGTDNGNVLYYDENMELIKVQTDGLNSAISIPVGCKYIIIQTWVDYENNDHDFSLVKSVDDYIYSYKENLINNDELIYGQYRHMTDYDIRYNENYVTTPLIPVDVGTYKFRHKYPTGNGGLFYFDESKNVIAYNHDALFRDKEIIIGADCKYISIQSWADGKNNDSDFVLSKKELFSESVVSDEVEIRSFLGETHIRNTGNYLMSMEISTYCENEEDSNTHSTPCIYFTSTDMLDLQSKDDGSKNVIVDLNVNGSIERMYGTVKVQGTSSQRYPKKNYTLTLYKDSECTSKNKIDVGWGKQYKYCLKANYVDTTHTRNVAGAKIASDIVNSRPNSSFKSALSKAPNNGLVDGFPCKVYVNGIFHGIYTWNIPKEDWMFSMEKPYANNLVLCAEMNNDGDNTLELSTEFRALWNASTESQWSVEVGTATDQLKKSFNNAIYFVMTSDDATFKNDFTKYFDLYSIIDYYIFSYLMCHLDGLGKNMLMITFNGVVWGASLYDMDSIFGANWDGQTFVSSDFACPESYQESNSLLWQRVVNNFKTEIHDRYFELRQGALSLANIVNKVESVYDEITDRMFSYEWEKWTELPCKDTNTMTRFRQYMSDRVSYVDSKMEELMN